MNDDPAPSLAARQRAPHSEADDELERDRHDDERIEETGEPSAAAQETARQQKRRAGLVRKLQSITHLQKSLDMTVVAYICMLYYMECSFARLLMRILPHYAIITPKDGPFLLPTNRLHVFAIFVPNILAVLFHSFISLPQAGESARGYLHGGVVIDFVGQKPPTWRLGLLSFDLIIFAVQCLMLAVHQEREKLRKTITPSLQTIPGTQADTTTTPETTQDHDAEERGVLREDTAVAAGDGDIELQPLVGAEERNEGTGGSGSDERMTASYSRATADLEDVMWSGSAVLSSFHVVHAVRTVGSDIRPSAGYSLQSLGYTASLAAAIAADRRARLTGRGQRPG